VMVSSYNSVSLDPPLVPWSLAKTSRSLEAFREAKAYVIHVLGRHQQALIARTRHDVPGSRSNF
jgi:3-hydroxy-9,10-secoandrosta-1,3,5(10)-triene-9,17-dione monooxygenase reductase component